MRLLGDWVILIADAFKILRIIFGMQLLVQFAYLRNLVLLKLGDYMYLKNQEPL